MRRSKLRPFPRSTWPTSGARFSSTVRRSNERRAIHTSPLGNRPFPSAWLMNPDPVDIMVIGSIAVNISCSVPSVAGSSLLLRTSHPAKIHSSVGGVAHNVALATSYVSSKAVRLVTAIGSDPQGAWVNNYAQRLAGLEGLDVAFINGKSDAETARYVMIHDKHGELVVATSDTEIIEGFQEDSLRKEIQRANPKYLAFDGCISPNSIKAILQERGADTHGKRYKSWH
jgi:pseudouridylate synthase / pseudouridine kinase